MSTGAPNTARAVEAGRTALGLRRALGFAGVGATTGAVVAVLVTLFGRLGAEPMHAWGWWLVALVGVGGFGAALAGWLTRSDAGAAARELDRRLALHDLLSSALELCGSHSPQAALLVARSERVAGTVRPRAVLPVSPAMRTGWWGWLGPVLAIAVAMGLWMPARVPSGHAAPAPAPAALTREAMDVVREAAAAMEASAAEEAVSGETPASEWQRELERELAVAGRSEVETRALAAGAAEAAAESLEQSAGRATDRADSLAERLAHAAEASRGELDGDPNPGHGGATSSGANGPGDALRDAIREGRLNNAAAALAEARKRLAEMSPQERETLARELERWANEVRPAEERGPEPETTPAAESGETPPSGDATPENGDAARSDPLAEQLRDAAREVRGDTGPPQPDPDSQSPGAEQPNPAERKPGDANPGDANPGDANPGDANPGDANPGDANPGDAKPGDTKPGDTKPGDTKPGDANRGDTKPGDTKPGDTKPGDTKPGDTKSGDTKPGDTKPGDAKPGDTKPGDTRTTQSSPGQSQPGTQAPGSTPTGQGPPQAPGQVPSGEVTAPQPGTKPGSGEQRPGGLEGLERTLRESERLRERASQDAARARHLRERARELLNPGEGGPGADQKDEPGGAGGGGESPEPRASRGMHDEQDPRGAGAFPPGDERLDLRPRGDAEGPMTPLAEWDRGPGDGSSAPVGAGVAGRLRAAAGDAERAIEDRRVPPEYADLVRRVFQRYVERAPSGGAP